MNAQLLHFFSCVFAADTLLRFLSHFNAPVIEASFYHRAAICPLSIHRKYYGHYIHYPRVRRRKHRHHFRPLCSGNLARSEDVEIDVVLSDGSSSQQLKFISPVAMHVQQWACILPWYAVAMADLGRPTTCSRKLLLLGFITASLRRERAQHCKDEDIPSSSTNSDDC
jgi:hypothetical protein